MLQVFTINAPNIPKYAIMFWNTDVGGGQCAECTPCLCGNVEEFGGVGVVFSCCSGDWGDPGRVLGDPCLMEAELGQVSFCCPCWYSCVGGLRCGVCVSWISGNFLTEVDSGYVLPIRYRGLLGGR